MLANVTPSLDVTGGPWYAGNDLDTEFIGALQSLAKQYIRKKVSISNHQNRMIVMRLSY
jgi:DNA-directed RNA polymerase III subunit RPC6